MVSIQTKTLCPQNLVQNNLKSNNRQSKCQPTKLKVSGDCAGKVKNKSLKHPSAKTNRNESQNAPKQITKSISLQIIR